MLYLGDGSRGRTRSPRKADPLHVVAETGKDYHLSPHRLQGTGRFHLALDAKGAVVDVARGGRRPTGGVAVKSQSRSRRGARPRHDSHPTPASQPPAWAGGSEPPPERTARRGRNRPPTPATCRGVRAAESATLSDHGRARIAY